MTQIIKPRNLGVDEQRMISIYSAEADTREETIAMLEKVIRHLEADEEELMALCQSTLGKLRAMSDEEYALIDPSPIMSGI